MVFPPHALRLAGAIKAGPNGPQHWTGLCATGTWQSPIDINTKQILPVSFNNQLGLTIHYQGNVASFTVKNTGYTLQILGEPLKQRYIEFNGDRYSFLQLHYHTPSEHEIDAKSYPLELHFVNIDHNNHLAVLGVLVKPGAFNPELQKMIVTTQRMRKRYRGNIDFSELLPSNTQGYYYYSGSLTTPPCSQGVNWFVFKTPITASAKQIAILSKRFGNTSRPLQPVNQRLVLSIN